MEWQGKPPTGEKDLKIEELTSALTKHRLKSLSLTWVQEASHTFEQGSPKQSTASSNPTVFSIPTAGLKEDVGTNNHPCQSNLPRNAA